MSHPFATGTPASTSGVTAGGIAINSTVATQANLAYAGDSDLATNFYTYYKVLRSRISVTAFPQATGDESNLVVVPGQSTGVVSTQDFLTQSAQPWAKDKMVSTGNNMRQNTIVMVARSHEILGMSEQEYLALPPTPVKTYPNATTNGLWYWVVFVGTADGANYAGIISITVSIDTDVEYSQLVSQVITE
jgi:hypothetical protein